MILEKREMFIMDGKLNDILLKFGFTTEKHIQGKKKIYLKGKHIGNFNASEMWKYLKEKGYIK
jgi:hypothetical protein